MSSTASSLANQWRSPSDVLSVLLIIGGDIVQTALAQTTGGLLTPICFSFGWVAYSFTALVGMIGEGRLLPPPDYPVKVFNLESGYNRENKNWTIGRLLRDNKRQVSKNYPLEDYALRIAIYAAQPNESPHRFRFFAPASRSIVLSGFGIMVAQLVIAAIPFILYQAWEVFLITASGTVLALVAGALPQWKAEKLSARQKTKKNVALWSGNGQRDVMIVLGQGKALDLEDLAAAETPRSSRPWEKFSWLCQTFKGRGNVEEALHYKSNPRAILWFRLPIGFWITWVLCAAESMCWLALLITVAGLSKNTWYLLAVGGLGMFQNAIVAAIDRTPKSRDIPLELLDCIMARKVMDGLMDLEDTYSGFGKCLLHEFFPGHLREDEERWWSDGLREDYERKREQDRSRGIPRKRMPIIKDASFRSILSNDRDPEKPPLDKADTATTLAENQLDSSVEKSTAARERRSSLPFELEGKAQAEQLTHLAKQAVSEKPASHVSLGSRRSDGIIKKGDDPGRSNAVLESTAYDFAKQAEQTEHAAGTREQIPRQHVLSNQSYYRVISPDWYRQTGYDRE